MVGEPLGGRALLNFSDSRKSRRKRRIFEKFSSHYLSIINLCDNYYISFRPRSFESVRGDRFEYLFGRKEGRKKAPVSLQPTFLTGRCETRASKETRQTVTREVAGSLYRSGRGGRPGDQPNAFLWPLPRTGVYFRWQEIGRLRVRSARDSRPARFLPSSPPPKFRLWEKRLSIRKHGYGKLNSFSFVPLALGEAPRMINPLRSQPRFDTIRIFFSYKEE